MYRSVVPAILKEYGIRYKKIHAPQKGYRNEIWPIELPHGEIINVTFYKREPGILDRIKRADAVSEYLYMHAMPTRRRLDARTLQLKNTQGITYVGLYPYLPGKTISWEAYTMKHVKLLGKTMSDMHALLAAMPPHGFPLVYDEYRLYIERMERYVSSLPVQTAIRQKLQVHTKSIHFTKYLTLLEVCQQLPHQQILHMDFVRGNILYDTATPQATYQQGGIALTGILDFEKTAVGHPMIDIARTLAFLIVDCKYKSAEKIEKYFLHSGYQKYGRNHDIGNLRLIHALVEFFLLYDFYKFLRHNPYEYLFQNEHFVRTRNILIERQVLQLT